MSDVIRVSIGTDPTQALPCAVLKSSILLRASRPVEFTESWTAENGWHPLMTRDASLKGKGTAFSWWRWLVPEVYGNEGRAIYQDVDQVCMCDIGELFDWPLFDSMDDLDDDEREQAGPAQKMFAAVIGAEGHIGDRGTAHELAVQTSVMLMDCAACDWSYPTLARQVLAGTIEAKPGHGIDPHWANEKNPQRAAYSRLMQAHWIDRDRIAPLPAEFNHFNIYEPGRTKIYHSTHSASQEWKTGLEDTPAKRMWFAELRIAYREGLITRQFIADEVAKGHVHKACLKAVQ